jgi:prephenate dehydratase
MKSRIAVQGWHGSFHDIAARNYFKADVEIVPCDSFPKLFEKIENDEADFIVMAIENSVAGSILPNYALIRDSDVSVTGEIFLRIQQNLMVLPGQKIEDLKEVHSHPMAIAQSRKFFDQYPDIKLIESVDTASSAKMIQDGHLKGVGAIAGKLAATTYDLEIIAESIETNHTNYTRFLVLNKKDKSNYMTIEPNKATICFTLPHKPGSLSHILSVLAFYDLDLTKIQSLPILGKEWQYLFYVDVKMTDYERYQQALNAVKPLADSFEILGEYRIGEKII